MNRVVTGYDDDGKAAILMEGAPPTVDRTDKYVTTELWITDRTPAPLSVTQDTSLAGYVLEPAPAGTRFRIVEILPGEFEAAPSATIEPDSGVIGEHRTETLDYIVVLRGEVTLVVGDRELTLYPGDAVVQNGVEHDWINRGTEPCVVVAVLVGGQR